MKKVLHRLSGILLSLIMALGLLPNMGIKAYAYDNNPYEDLVLDFDDNEFEVSSKKVTFGGLSWYIIEDDSVSAEEGTLTLFSKDCIGDSVMFNANPDDNQGSTKYSECSIKGVVDAMTEEGGVLADVAGAIKTVDLQTMDSSGENVYDTVNGVKCYLIDAETANKLPVAARCCIVGAGSFMGYWWFRSPGGQDYFMGCADGNGGDIADVIITLENGVRPALVLDLSSVVFSPDSKEFSVKTADITVTLTGGDNSVISGGKAVQNGLTGGPMETVIYTAKSGFHFEPFDNISQNGVTVKRINNTVVEVSGTPKANVNIKIPNARYDNDPYVGLIPANSDDMDALAGKQVVFNKRAWYIIADDSVSPSEGTVTLLSVKPIGDDIIFCKIGANNTVCGYDESVIKEHLDAMTAVSGQPFADVAGVIADSDLPDVSVTGAKLYLLSLEEAAAIPKDVLKLGNKAKWWLRSPGTSRIAAAYVDGAYGVINENDGYVVNTYSVRPALKLNLASVDFSSAAHFFTVGPGTDGYSVIMTGGENAYNKSGNLYQTGLTGAMKDVDFYADDGYSFGPFADFTKSGITVKRIDETHVTVSGTPISNVHIVILDAVPDISASVKQKPTAKTLVYNGQLQELVEAGKASLGYMCYAVTKDGEAEPGEENYKENIPKKIAPGNYRVWYMARGVTGYANSASDSITVTIEKANARTIDDIAVTRSIYDTSVFTVSVAGKMPSDAGVLSYEKQDLICSGSVVASDFSVDEDGNVRVRLSSSSSGDKVTLPVSIGSSNYKDSSVRVDITFVDRIEVAIPDAVTGLRWTGEEQTGVGPGDDYTLSGNKATAVGNYKARASLENVTTHVWSDGSSEDKDIPWVIAKAEGPGAPSGLKGIAPTEKNGSDGRITGVSSDMEFSKESDLKSWTSCQGTEITGLAAGKYHIRAKETETHEAGVHAVTEVPEFIDNTSGMPEQIKTPVASISLNMTAAAIKKNGTLTLTATIHPDNATDKSVIWSVADSAVAAVSDGAVTAKETGKTIVTASSKDGGFTASCEILVVSDELEQEVMDKIEPDRQYTNEEDKPIESRTVTTDPVKVKEDVTIPLTYEDAISYTGKKIDPKTQLSAEIDFNALAKDITIKDTSKTIEDLVDVEWVVSGKDKGKRYFYPKLKLSANAKKASILSKKDRESLKKLINKANKALKKKGARREFTVNKRSLTDGVLLVKVQMKDNAIKLKNKKIAKVNYIKLKISDDDKDTITLKNGKDCKITLIDAASGLVKVEAKNKSNFTGSVTLYVVK